MALCVPRLSSHHHFVDQSPVLPCRESRYQLDARPSLEAHDRDHSPSLNAATRNATLAQPAQPPLRRKRAYDTLNQAAPKPAQAGGTAHRRTSSLDKFIKKMSAILKHKSSAQSFGSVLVKAGTGEQAHGSKRNSLNHKKNMLNLRFEFEQATATPQGPATAQPKESGDGESAWETDTDEDADGGVAL